MLPVWPTPEAPQRRFRAIGVVFGDGEIMREFCQKHQAELAFVVALHGRVNLPDTGQKQGDILAAADVTGVLDDDAGAKSGNILDHASQLDATGAERRLQGDVMAFGPAVLLDLDQIAGKGDLVSYCRKLVTVCSGGVLNLLYTVLEPHALDDLGEMI